jgi:arabinofuranosyltransferase
MHNSNYIAANSTSVTEPATLSRFAIILDALAAIFVTVVCSFLVYKDLGKPVLTGIDDENITQVYGQNLAHGFGYVYTPNFEHVEGATSPLWVAVHWLAYSLTAQPEPFIFIFCILLTGLTLYWSLGIARWVASALVLPAWTIWIAMLATVAQPAFFHWTVVTMMDQGLWATVVVGLMYVLVRETSNPDRRPRNSVLGVLLCALSVLARPESMLLMPAMLAIAAVVVAINKGAGSAIRYAVPYFAAVGVALAGLTAFRLQYFGYPFPNTYYAKVSSNPIDNIVQGYHYIVGFLSSNVLTIPCVLAVALALLIGLQALWSSVKAKTALRQAHAIMLLLGGTVAVVFATLVLEGGDHFPAFRMLQPYVPLLSVALLIYVPLLAGWNELSLSRAAGGLWCAGVVVITLLANYAAFATANKSLKEDFSLAADGRRIGNLLSELGDPRADVGVLPAGGIAVTYQGRIVDLLGLNWSEMAHASGRRVGMAGHSAFNLDVFWKHPPELMLPELSKPTGLQNEKAVPANFEIWVLQGLLNQRQFRDEYSPVLVHVGGGTVFAYARESFVSRYVGDSRVEALPWTRFRDAPAEPTVTVN